MYYTYMLRCKDESIYTGIAADLERRMEEHFSKDKKCAKYTRTHTAKKLEAAWKTEDRILASKLEYQIKNFYGIILQLIEYLIIRGTVWKY